MRGKKKLNSFEQIPLFGKFKWLAVNLLNDTNSHVFNTLEVYQLKIAARFSTQPEAEQENTKPQKCVHKKEIKSTRRVKLSATSFPQWEEKSVVKIVYLFANL